MCLRKDCENVEEEFDWTDAGGGGGVVALWVRGAGFVRDSNEVRNYFVPDFEPRPFEGSRGTPRGGSGGSPGPVNACGEPGLGGETRLPSAFLPSPPTSSVSQQSYPSPFFQCG